MPMIPRWKCEIYEVVLNEIPRLEDVVDEEKLF